MTLFTVASRRQVADVPVDHSKQAGDRGLVGGDAVQIADGAPVGVRRLFPAIPSGIEPARKDRSILPMNSTKSHEVIWGGRVMAAKLSAEMPANGL